MHPASILNHDIQIRIYNTITTNCVNPVIENRLIHLFKGCTDKCCTNSRYYHEPNAISVEAATGPSTSSTTATPVATNCDISPSTLDFQTPHSTVHEVTTKPSTSSSTATADYAKTEESISPTTQHFQTSHSTIHKVTILSPQPALLLSLLQILIMIQYE